MITSECQNDVGMNWGKDLICEGARFPPTPTKDEPCKLTPHCTGYALCLPKEKANDSFGRLPILGILGRESEHRNLLC